MAVGTSEGDEHVRHLEPFCSRLQAIGALRSALTLKQAVDQLAATFSVEIFEELTGHRSGWSPEEYERWLSERLSEMLLHATGPRVS